MPTEIEDLREHFDRYRAVTLQHLDRLADHHLQWRPRPDAFSCGQHFVHIVQTEEFYMRGLFEHEWNPDRMRFPKVLPTATDLKQQFELVRRGTLTHFAALTERQLAIVVPPLGGAPVEWSLRSWLWYVLEHEVHHKAHVAEYMRQMGLVPPFFALAIPDRPDIAARGQLGGI